MRLEPDLLRRVPAFAPLSTSACEALALCFHGRPYARGAVIFRKEDPATSMFFIASGEVTLSHGVASTRESGPVAAGQLLGVEALIDPSPRWANAEAAQASVVFEAGVDTLEILRGAAPDAARALTGAAISSVARRLRQLEKRVLQELERGGPLP
jgi:CRP-like cAMP-binding protein